MKRIHQNLKKIKEINMKEYFFVIFFLLLVSVCYSIVAVGTHNHYQTFGLDLGTFDEAIWKISRGIFPYSSSGCNWLLEDHFQVILYFLSPLYWIWENVRVILIFQSFWMVFSAFPLYILSKKITKNIFFSFSIVFSYLFFMGTQFAILNEFHQATFAPFFIALFYWAVEKNNKWVYWFSILMLFLIKEDLALLVGSMGFGLLFKEKWRVRGLVTSVLGVSIFFLLTYVLMPLISIRGVYDHFTHFKSVGGATNPLDTLKNLVSRPLFLFQVFFGHPLKIKTLAVSFFTFAILPIFSPLFVLIPLVADFSLRFIYEGPQITKWMLVNHHAATGAMLLSVSSAYACQRLSKKITLKRRKIFITILGLFLILTTLCQDILLKAPIHSLFKKDFYAGEEWVKDADDVIRRVPKNASIASQNNLLSHLTERKSAYRLPYGLNSEYIIVDFYNQPNAYAPLSYEEMKKFVNDWILKDNRYSVVYQKGQAMLLKRNFKKDISKSPYYGNIHYCYYSFEER